MDTNNESDYDVELTDEHLGRYSSEFIIDIPNKFGYCMGKFNFYNVVEWTKDPSSFSNMACWAAQGGCLVSDCNNKSCNLLHKPGQYSPIIETKAATFRVLIHLYEILSRIVPINYYATHLEIFTWLVSCQRSCARPYFYSYALHPQWAIDPDWFYDDIEKLNEIYDSISEPNEKLRCELSLATFYRNKEIDAINFDLIGFFGVKDDEVAAFLLELRNIVVSFYDNSWYSNACLAYKQTNEFKKFSKIVSYSLNKYFTVCYDLIDNIFDYYLILPNTHPILLLINQLDKQMHM